MPDLVRLPKNKKITWTSRQQNWYLEQVRKMNTQVMDSPRLISDLAWLELNDLARFGAVWLGISAKLQ